MTGRVVTLGNALVDVVARVPHLPQRGGDVLADGGSPTAGGGGLRAVAAARTAGVEAVYAGRIGTGPFGDLVASALDRLGVPAPLPRVADADTGFAIALIEADGERTFVTVPGAEAAPPSLDGVDPVPGDLLHVHGYGLVAPGRGAAVADLVADVPTGVVVLLDPGPFGAGADPAALDRLLDRVDWWSGNAAEALAATGSADPVAAAGRIAGRVRRGAVVRCGADGCVVAERDRPPAVLPAPRVVAVDTNGAGDTHVGVFLARLAQGDAPEAAAQAANAAAAAAVARVRG